MPKSNIRKYSIILSTGRFIEEMEKSWTMYRLIGKNDEVSTNTFDSVKDLIKEYQVYS